MKYLLIMYVDHEMWEGLTADQQLSAFQGDGDFDRLISETGELVESKTLSDPITAKTVHVRDGVPSTIDSPVHKSDAFVCGYYVVDVTDEKSARSSWPASCRTPHTVRSRSAKSCMSPVR
ncbi:YciI family protein [Fodinicola feengrottensis]|uniref:YciI family protein n=1 Tax=Fodinicola feengrottensis TaxID=435914 RepID=UPI0013D5F8A1|nr:hypothetical protein [Fodinicola feengrottensis]